MGGCAIYILSMKGGLLIALILAGVSLFAIHQLTPPPFPEFEQWKLHFHATFETPAEEQYRRTIFYKNLEEITRHNAQPDTTFKMGINQFTVLSQVEFQERFLSLGDKRWGERRVSNGLQNIPEKAVQAVIVDWVEKGAVAPVKTQGNCGSAVLFSTLGGVQGLTKVATGTLQIISEQQLIDCVFGCAGAQPTQGYSYYKTHTVCNATEYPYTGKAGTCQNKQCSFKISDYRTVSNCNDLASAITKQPISVAVDATKWATYSSGIFNNCGNSLDHMVLLVGLADEYWKLKNSWGTTWGEKGYIRLARGNTCGICQYGLYPVK